MAAAGCPGTEQLPPQHSRAFSRATATLGCVFVCVLCVCVCEGCGCCARPGPSARAALPHLGTGRCLLPARSAGQPRHPCPERDPARSSIPAGRGAGHGLAPVPPPHLARGEAAKMAGGGGGPPPGRERQKAGREAEPSGIPRERVPGSRLSPQGAHRPRDGDATHLRRHRRRPARR